MILDLPDDAAVTHEGQAVINSIHTQHNTPDFLVLDVDMQTKYVDPVVAWDNTGHEVHLHVTEHSLRKDESKSIYPTTIRLPARCKDWSVIAQGGRYTIHIVAWRVPE